MSKLKATTLLGWVESDDEDSDILSSGHKPAPRRMVPPKKPVTTARPAQTTTRQPNTAATRKALAEKPANVPEKPMAEKGRKRAAPEEAPADPNPQDENAIEANAKPKGARGRPRAAKAAKIAAAETEDDEAPEPQPEPKPKAKAAAQQPPAKRGRKPKAKAEVEQREIPETQLQEEEPEIPETQQLEATELSVDVENDEDEIIEPLPAFNSRAGMSSAQRPQSQQNLFGASHRSVPASDSKVNDPLMKRRMADLTRKYQELEARYQDLREIGVIEAERNYDRLKQQSEEKSKTANELIATLKAQVAAQADVAKESQRLRQQLDASQAKADELQGQLSEANSSLAGAKTEIKTLSTKLGAARSAEQASVKVPGSAIKGNSAGDKRLLANAEAAVQQAQMKEDLYADLTGLIVRGIKREKDEDIYDCIQTGRNGTLHFKLAVGADGAASGNFEESQFVYMPQLDPDRDEALVDVLPDYLQEEITFPRPQAAKFYARVMKSLTERIAD